MRTIDEIIEDAQRAAAESLRTAFASGGAEIASAFRARMEAAVEQGSAPVDDAPANAASTAAGGEAPRLETTPEPIVKPALRAVLLSAAAMLTLALWHARAARILPACAVLIGLGVVLRDWSGEDGAGE